MSRYARWIASFAGFPLGGLAAMILTGPVATPFAAATGGLVTGAVLGAAQALALGLRRRPFVIWTFATSAGLAVGLTLGAGAAGFGTGLGDLARQGAVSGLAVGAAQAVILARPLGALALAWPAYLAGAWTLGWTVTTAVGVRVEEQFTVFGAAGALTVAVLTAVLPLLLARTPSRTVTGALRPVAGKGI